MDRKEIIDDILAGIKGLKGTLSYSAIDIIQHSDSPTKAGIAVGFNRAINMAVSGLDCLVTRLEHNEKKAYVDDLFANESEKVHARLKESLTHYGPGTTEFNLLMPILCGEDVFKDHSIVLEEAKNV